MALQGNIDSFSVVDVLRLLGSSAKSGRLVVDGDRGSGSLWLADGLVTCGTTTHPGAAPVGASPGDVLFDLLRFVDGAFVFEADVEPTALAEAAGAAPVDVEALIDAAADALREWDEIVAVVPSLRTLLSLTVDLPADTVEVDRDSWSGIVALASVAASGGATTVAALASLAGLTELPALRLVRHLVGLGLVEVGHEAPEEPRFEPAFAHTPFDAPLESTSVDPPAFEPAAFEPAAFEPAGFEPAGFEPAGFEAPVPPRYEPGEVPSPIGEVRAPEEFDVFAPFDPFGTAPADHVGSTPDAASSEAASFETAPFETAPFETAPFETSAPAVDEDDEAQKAEFARQLAMLSPRAAEAVASAEAGPSTEDEERARVARFLGSV